MDSPAALGRRNRTPSAKLRANSQLLTPISRGRPGNPRGASGRSASTMRGARDQGRRGGSRSASQAISTGRTATITPSIEYDSPPPSPERPPLSAQYQGEALDASSNEESDPDPLPLLAPAMNSEKLWHSSPKCKPCEASIDFGSLSFNIAHEIYCSAKACFSRSKNV
jgi:hypothetical protein